jgi:hypothetical protein
VCRHGVACPSKDDRVLIGALVMRQVGFPKRDLDKLEKALVHTHCVLWVRATTKSRYAREGQLIGFARATSDGALSATIWDVAVWPCLESRYILHVVWRERMNVIGLTGFSDGRKEKYELVNREHEYHIMIDLSN